MIFLRINCPNAARHVASATWAFEVVIGVRRQIVWLSKLYYDTIWYDMMHYIYVRPKADE